MGNSYKYLDPNHKYTDENGILYNIENIKDEKVLAVYESLKVSRRLEELYERPLKIKDSNSLLTLHHYLFQDVYEWAGETRTVNISKDGKPFFEGERFEMGFKYIDNLILEYRNIKRDNKKELAIKLADILDNVNFLHPFRDGNGRAQREFLRILALEKGLTLNLNPADNEDVYKRYMKGTINSDIEILTSLIYDLINKSEA